jgi:hypothetical protein
VLIGWFRFFLLYPLPIKPDGKRKNNWTKVSCDTLASRFPTQFLCLPHLRLMWLTAARSEHQPGLIRQTTRVHLRYLIEQLPVLQRTLFLIQCSYVATLKDQSYGHYKTVESRL